MSRRAGLSIALTVVMALACVPSSAFASFHLNRISEVYPGTIASPDSAFVELQAFQAGQNLVSGHQVKFFDLNGAVLPAATTTLSANVPNAQTQRTILIADQFPPDAVTADFTNTAIGTNIVPSGGAVCFEAIDCVAWGNITPAGLAALPSPAGNPVAPLGIPDGSSLVRSIAGGCPTFFEGADDTNDSATDLALTTDPNPRPNSVSPPETTCLVPAPETIVDKGPKPKVRSRKVTFKFSSPDPGATFECKLDSKPFKGCESPLKQPIKPGKHAFQVRAVLAGEPDPSPVIFRFRRLRPKH